MTAIRKIGSVVVFLGAILCALVLLIALPGAALSVAGGNLSTQLGTATALILVLILCLLSFKTALRLWRAK